MGPAFSQCYSIERTRAMRQVVRNVYRLTERPLQWRHGTIHSSLAPPLFFVLPPLEAYLVRLLNVPHYYSLMT